MIRRGGPGKRSWESSIERSETNGRLKTSCLGTGGERQGMTIATYASATLNMASLQHWRLYAQWYVASQKPRLRT